MFIIFPVFIKCIIPVLVTDMGFRVAYTVAPVLGICFDLFSGAGVTLIESSL